MRACWRSRRFEQNYPDFVPGYKTHTVEHHAIDAAGHIGPASQFKATVLPGAKPNCTRTLTGAVSGSVVMSEGVTCLDGASVGGDVVVRDGGSLVVSGGQITGRLDAAGARDVQLFGTKVLGSTSITGGDGNTTLANNVLSGGLTLSGNDETPFGLAVVANTIYRGLDCTDTTRAPPAPVTWSTARSCCRSRSRLAPATRPTPARPTTTSAPRPRR